MPGPYVVPVHGDADLPKSVDVVVIGGGIIGSSTALELAESGVKVALCEKGGIGHEQSSRNWGWVRITRRDPREVPLMVEALRIWQGYEKRTGRDMGYRKSGIVFTCATDLENSVYESWNENLVEHQMDSRMLSPNALGQMFPAAKFDVKGALYSTHDGRAEPQKAAPAIAEAARDRGAHILTECAVRGVETSAGAISAVVLAGGAWSGLFAGNMGIDFPQLKVMNSVLRTTPIHGGPEQAISHRDFAMRKRQDGGYTIASGHENIVNIVPKSFRYARQFLPALRKEWRSLNSLDEPSPFEYNRVLDPAPNKTLSNKALSAAKRAFSVLENAHIAQRWAGYIDVTPDAVPVISAAGGVSGFYLASGFSGHGFGIGPAAGHLMADLVMNRTPIVDPTSFRFNRFTDGSKMELFGGF
jgi:glycine/D-amino acid oxidase-like deaminating enzyme